MANSTHVEGMVNIEGKNIKSNDRELGGWNYAARVIFVGIIESFVFYGVSSNLTMFLTIPLGQSTAAAAQNVNGWSGFMHMLPVLLTSCVGNFYYDRFYAIAISVFIYVGGISALSIYMGSCSNYNNNKYNLPCKIQGFFFFALYQIGIASAGFKTCAAAYGADQFDERNPNEYKSRSSFFKWWLFGLSLGSCSSQLILNYVGENSSWYEAFKFSKHLMIFSFFLLLGARYFTFTPKKDADKVNPLEGLTNGLVGAVQNCRTTSSPSSVITKKVKPTTNNTPGSRKLAGTCSTFSKCEDVKAVLRLVPVWIICLTYPIVHSQVITFFVKQGSTMDRSIQPDFQIPAASIQIFLTVSVVLFAATYDRIFVTVTRAFTGKSNSITSLQKIGAGIFVSAVTMVVAAIVENRRLEIAQVFGLVDDPKATVPMVIWWLVPQYVLSGLSLVLTQVGLQEFFYGQVPNELRSAGLSLYSTIFGIGDFFNVFLIYVIQKVTSAGGQHGWLANNMNQAHFDYFYWFLAGLSILELVAFLCFAKSHVYKQGAPM